MSDYKFSEFGNRLKILREQQGFKQGQFADKIGITRQSMSNYESGKHSPDIDVIIKMANYLGCSTDYLMGLTEHSNYEKHIEFDESLSKLSKSLYAIPEPLRIHWLDIFVGISECLEKDLKENAEFHFSVKVFFNALISLIKCCSTTKEMQAQGSYVEHAAHKSRNKRFYLISALRSELNKLDNLSYEYIETALKNEVDNMKTPKLQELQNQFEQLIQSKGDE